MPLFYVSFNRTPWRSVLLTWEESPHRFGSGTVFRLSPLKTTVDPQKREESIPGDMLVARAAGSAHSPRSEAVTNELQELSLQPAPSLLPLRERKNDRHGRALDLGAAPEREQGNDAKVDAACNLLRWRQHNKKSLVPMAAAGRF
ncbi:hypothetical protein CRUP_004886 [Coryphaenoides rupestris]|nr:hypothetical protein CRUP_004886 [Coryphaenoides rupestris]